MAITTYECLFLLDPNKASADWDGVTTSIHQILERHGATIEVSRPWGELKLAYPIGKFRKGSYFLMYFKVDSVKTPDIEADFRLNNNIVRHLVVRLHEKLADGVVQVYREDSHETEDAGSENEAVGAS